MTHGKYFVPNAWSPLAGDVGSEACQLHSVFWRYAGMPDKDKLHS